MICPKCKKEFNQEPAISRRNKSEICPICGHREALEDAINSSAISKEEADEILKALSANEEI